MMVMKLVLVMETVVGVSVGDGVGVGKRGEGLVNGIWWRRRGRVNSGTSLQYNLPIFSQWLLP